MDARRTILIFLATCCLLPAAGCKNESESIEAGYETCARFSTCTSGDSLQIPIGLLCDWFLTSLFHAEDDQSSQLKVANALLDCYRRAADCEAVLACVLADSGQQAQCAGHEGSMICLDQIAVFCPHSPDQALFGLNCGRADQVCGALAGSADCGLSICDPASDTKRCDGRLLLTCDDAGVWQSEDCRYHFVSFCNAAGDCRGEAGETCGAGLYGELACVGDGPGCDPETFESRCDGKVLVSCTHGRQARLDCRDLTPWHTCRLDPDGGFANCVLEADECQFDFAESCVDGVITFCSMGEIRQLDCKQYGLSGCDSAADNLTSAWCTE